jgi:hypothetical protein
LQHPCREGAPQNPGEHGPNIAAATCSRKTRRPPKRVLQVRPPLGVRLLARPKPGRKGARAKWPLFTT